MNKKQMLEMKLTNIIRPIVGKILSEVNDVEYYILYHANDNYGPPKTIFKTNKFDKNELQKTFDEFAKKMEVGDILEYGKSDSKRFHPSLLEVEMTKKGLVRTTPNGRSVKYNPKY
jgi:hypothetical protein